MDRSEMSITMSSDEVKSRIEPGLRSTVRDGTHTIEYLDARTLLTEKRIDVPGKSRLLRPLSQGSRSAQDLYLELIKILTAGKFREAEDAASRDYLASFLRLNEQIKKHGLSHEQSIVPVSQDGDIINGSHRVAIALATGSLVPTVKLDAQAPNYAATQLMHMGCRDILVRQCVESFVEHVETYALVVWPSAVANFERIAKRVPRAVHQETFHVGRRGILRLIEACYFGEEWIQSGPQALAHKAELVSERDGDGDRAGIVIFQAGGLEKVSILKDELRALAGNSPHSLHISDSHTETVRIVRLALNRNSLHFARYSPIVGNQFADGIVLRARDALNKSRARREGFAVDGGAVLAMYGLRNTSDVDVIVDHKSEFDAKFLGVSRRTDSEIRLHGEPREGLLDNSDLHFWYRDVKFVALHQVARMKRLRGEPKDVSDLQLIGDLDLYGANTVTSSERWAYRRYWTRNKVEAGLKRIGLHSMLRLLVVTIRSAYRKVVAR